MKKLLDIGDVNVVGINKEDELIASVVIVLKKGNVIKDKNIIETFIHQAAIAFQRKESEENLLQSEKQLREMNAAKDKLFSIIIARLAQSLSGFAGLCRSFIKRF